MALFKQIQTVGDLPSIGASREKVALDFKAEVKDEERFELGKDMAAFANAMGGVILVGADENKETGTLRGYVPLDQERAQVICEAYNKAAVERCFPSPVIDALTIERDSGKYVVAVNVWPFPTQLVGVAHDKAQHVYAFPLRVGVHTKHLRPEQLPMLMVTGPRRAAILLSQIDANKTIHLTDGDGNAHNFASLEIDQEGSMVRFRLGDGRRYVDVPLEAIDLVWRATARDMWRVTMRGSIQVMGGELDSALEYYPPRP